MVLGGGAGCLHTGTPLAQNGSPAINVVPLVPQLYYCRSYQPGPGLDAGRLAGNQEACTTNPSRLAHRKAPLHDSEPRLGPPLLSGSAMQREEGRGVLPVVAIAFACPQSSRAHTQPWRVCKCPATDGVAGSVCHDPCLQRGCGRARQGLSRPLTKQPCSKTYPASCPAVRCPTATPNPLHVGIRHPPPGCVVPASSTPLRSAACCRARPRLLPAMRHRMLCSPHQPPPHTAGEGAAPPRPRRPCRRRPALPAPHPFASPHLLCVD